MESWTHESKMPGIVLVRGTRMWWILEELWAAKLGYPIEEKVAESEELK